MRCLHCHRSVQPGKRICGFSSCEAKSNGQWVKFDPQLAALQYALWNKFVDAGYNVNPKGQRWNVRRQTLEALEKRGLLRRVAGVNRDFELTEEGRTIVEGPDPKKEETPLEVLERSAEEVIHLLHMQVGSVSSLPSVNELRTIIRELKERI